MPKSQCRGCGEMFKSLSAFDLHRTGKFRRNGLRCLIEHEVRAKGMVQNERSWWMRSAFDGTLLWPAPRNEEESA